MSKKRKQRLPYSHRFDALGDLKPSLLFPLSPRPLLSLPLPSLPLPRLLRLQISKCNLDDIVLCKEHGKIKCIL